MLAIYQNIDADFIGFILAMAEVFAQNEKCRLDC